MFTGIITHTGKFKAYGSGKRDISIDVGKDFPRLDRGESVAVNGVCLSLLKRERDTLSFQLSQETKEKTTLGALKSGQKLNLELPMTLSSFLSGHLVSGHIDAKGKVAGMTKRPPGLRMKISYPRDLQKYLVAKGSVAVDGVSLTIALIDGLSFEVELIPLTVINTGLAGLRPGDEVNIECDMVGKYVYNVLSHGHPRKY